MRAETFGGTVATFNNYPRFSNSKEREQSRKRCRIRGIPAECVASKRLGEFSCDRSPPYCTKTSEFNLHNTIQASLESSVGRCHAQS
jgi:hypothetical protein